MKTQTKRSNQLCLYILLHLLTVNYLSATDIPVLEYPIPGEVRETPLSCDTEIFRVQPKSLPLLPYDSPSFKRDPNALRTQNFGTVQIYFSTGKTNLEDLRRGQGYFANGDVMFNRKLGDYVSDLKRLGYKDVRVLRDTAYDFSVAGGNREAIIIVAKPPDTNSPKACISPPVRPSGSVWFEMGKNVRQFSISTSRNIRSAAYNLNERSQVINPTLNVGVGVNQISHGIDQSIEGNGFEGSIRGSIGTYLTVGGTSAGLYSLGYGGASLTVGTLAAPAAACVGGVTFAGGGLVQCYRQSPGRYTPTKGYASFGWEGYKQTFKSLYCGGN